MKSLRHEFVEFIPSELEDGVLYISIAFATAAHKCCCGCGCEVITPITPTDWKITFDGESVSLSPSIGNWSFECRSHYWITRNRIRWAETWSAEEIAAGRAHDHSLKQDQFDERQFEFAVAGQERPGKDSEKSVGRTDKGNFWSRLSAWLGRFRK